MSAGSRRRSCVLLGVAALGLLVGVGIALAVVVTGDDDARTVEVVVPAGTQARLDAGEVVDVMPARLELDVGDTLLIRNEDEVEQAVGPFRVPARDEVSFTYGRAGRYEGYCPLSAGERYLIVVGG